MLVRASGKPNVEWYVKTASTQFKNGALVQLSSGQLIEGTATSTNHLGVILRDVLSTDSDYASAVKVPVDVADDNTIFEADVKAGVTALASHVGVVCDISVDGSTKDVTVDPTTTTHGQVTVVGFISASKVLVKVNSVLTTKNAS